MAEEKLKIIAFKKNDFTGQIGEFELRYNPPKMQHNFAITYDTLQTFGSSGNEGRYKYSYPETLSFEFLFDNTIVPANKVLKTVKEDIDKFKELAFTYNGTIHRPNYLKLSWGKFLFKCQISSFNITYTAFSTDGEPIKANASVKFVQVRNVSTRLSEENKSSPDLSHIYIVQEGDSLPSISHSVYADISYYLNLAKVNKLSNFRQLVPGQKLILPPLEK
ncbi:MAG: LysM peptidoglycan-binding domain-containing protein [Saprospiraceae bacterium]|nr:LysM peptidoglycan-binding domain-containing protein [Saprospiraceae bacterium]